MMLCWEEMIVISKVGFGYELCHWLKPCIICELKAWKFGCRARRAREDVVILRRPSSNNALHQNPKPFT